MSAESPCSDTAGPLGPEGPKVSFLGAAGGPNFELRLPFGTRRREVPFLGAAGGPNSECHRRFGAECPKCPSWCRRRTKFRAPPALWGCRRQILNTTGALGTKPQSDTFLGAEVRANYGPKCPSAPQAEPNFEHRRHFGAGRPRVPFHGAAGEPNYERFAAGWPNVSDTMNLPRIS